MIIISILVGGAGGFGVHRLGMRSCLGLGFSALAMVWLNVGYCTATALRQPCKARVKGTIFYIPRNLGELV